jgi:hypothetical protein
VCKGSQVVVRKEGKRIRSRRRRGERERERERREVMW